MVEPDDITASTRLRVEMTSNVSLGDVQYFLQTENAGMSSVSIVIKVYRNGDLVFTHTEPFGKEINPNNMVELEKAIRGQHNLYFGMVKNGRFKEGKKALDFIDETKIFIRKRSYRQAMYVLKAGYEMYPDDPFIMSHYGYMLATVDKKFSQGIDLCKNAIERLKIALSAEARPHYPLFYLHLCRAYLAADNRYMAVETAFKGVKYDRDNGPLHKELVKLGIRQKPPIPFLSRSHPINKLLGKITHSFKQREEDD